MKTEKIKRYRLGVSRNFPTTHPRKGKETWFTDKIEHALGKFEACTIYDHVNNEKTIVWPKLHTIRSNYQFWAKRLAEVQEGRAVIELFYWSGKPYNSPQVVFATLDKDSGCGVQVIKIYKYVMDEIERYDTQIWDYDNVTRDEWPKSHYSIEKIAANDGLTLEDFKAWFKGYDLSNDLAIIHFTKFRY